MSLHVVRGDDPILRADALDSLLDALAGDEDRGLLVEEFAVPPRTRGGGGDDRSADDADDAPDEDGEDVGPSAVAAAVNAARSPPFMTTRRIVVVRDVGALTAGEAKPLIACFADLLESTELILVVGGGAVPTALSKAWTDARAEQHGGATAKGADVLADALAEVGLTMRPDAAAAVVDRVGGEVGRIPAIVEVLVAAYGPGARLGVDDVAPYLGEAGSIPPYELTNAIEDGDVPRALAVLQRILSATGPQQPKPMHPLQVMAMLHNRLRRIARLDDPAIRTAADAAAALGGRVKEFAARKTLEPAQRLGPTGIREAYALLAQADLDLKGARAIPERAVMEVLVARLAALSARSGASARRGGSRRGKRR